MIHHSSLWIRASKTHHKQLRIATVLVRTAFFSRFSPCWSDGNIFENYASAGKRTLLTAFKNNHGDLRQAAQTMYRKVGGRTAGYDA
jgi:hypothetical protein